MLQLFITSVAWAGGLALVIGSIVLVTTAAAPRHTVPPLRAAQRGDQNSLPQVAPSTAFYGASRSPGSRVLASFSGHSNKTTARFNVRAERRWQLRWSYRCGPRAGAKQFTLLRADMGRYYPTISTITEDFATSGRGAEWLGASGHRHYLEVISACSWHVRVVQEA